MRIQIDNSDVLLFEDTTFTLSRTSPLFSGTEDIKGYFIYSISFPHCPQNDKIFGFVQRTDAVYERKDFLFVLNYRSLTLSGIFTLTNYDESFSGDVVIDESVLLKNIDGLSLKDLTTIYHITGDENDPSALTTFALDKLNTDSNVMQFPSMVAPNFYADDEDEEFCGVVNKYQNSSFLNNANGGTNVYNFSPQFFLVEILKQIFNQQSCILTNENLLLDTTFLKTLVQNCYALDFLMQVQTFFGTLDRQIFRTDFTDFMLWLIPGPVIMQFLPFPFDENFDPDNMFTSSPSLDPTLNHFNLTVGKTYKFKGTIKITLYMRANIVTTDELWAVISIFSTNSSQVVEALFEIPIVYDPFPTTFEKEIEIDYDFTATDSTTYFAIGFSDCIENVIPNDNVSAQPFIKFEGSIDVANTEYIDNNVYSRTITLADHVPDIDQKDIFSLIKNLFGAAYFSDSSIQGRFVSYKEILTTKPVEFPEDLLNLTEIDFENYEGTLFSYKSEKEEIFEENYIGEYLSFSWLPAFAKRNALALVSDEKNYYIYTDSETSGYFKWVLNSVDYGEYIHQTKTDETLTIPADLAEMSNFEDYTMPAIYENGGSAAYNQKNEFDAKLMLWHGLRTIGFSTYPFASPLDFAADISNLSDHSLDIEADNGPAKSWWKEYFRFKSSTRKFTCNSKLSIPQLQALKLYVPYYRDNFAFVIASHEVEISLNNHSVVKLELYAI